MIRRQRKRSTGYGRNEGITRQNVGIIFYHNSNATNLSIAIIYRPAITNYYLRNRRNSLVVQNPVNAYWSSISMGNSSAKKFRTSPRSYVVAYSHRSPPPVFSSPTVYKRRVIVASKITRFNTRFSHSYVVSPKFVNRTSIMDDNYFHRLECRCRWKKKRMDKSRRY